MIKYTRYGSGDKQGLAMCIYLREPQWAAIKKAALDENRHLANYVSCVLLKHLSSLDKENPSLGEP